MESNVTLPRQFVAMIRELEAAEASAKINTDERGWPTPEARSRLETARDNLRVALAEAQWGQNGSVFVTDERAGYDGGRLRTLWINGRPRVRLGYDYRRRTDPGQGWLKIIPAVEAEKIFRERKLSAKANEAEYQLARDQLMSDLVVAGQTTIGDIPDWSYCNGQEGGYFYSHRIRGACVSAWGAMRGAWGRDWWTTPVVRDDLAHLLPWSEEDEIERRFFGAKY